MVIISVTKSKNRIEFYALGKDKDDIFKKLEDNSYVRDLTLGENSSDTFKSHFHKALIMDTTQLEKKTYITLDTEISKSENLKIKCINIIFEIFTSLPLLELSLSEQNKFYTAGFFGNRIDCLSDAIKRSLIDIDIGIGHMTLAPLNPVKIIYPTTGYYGKRIIFQVYDY